MTKRARITPSSAAQFIGVTLLSVAAGYGIRSTDTSQASAIETASNNLTTSPVANWESDGSRAPASKHIEETLRAMGGTPSIEEIFASSDLGRYEKLARYLATATATDCDAVNAELINTGKYLPHLNNMIFLRWAEVDPIGAAAQNKHATAWAWAKHDPDAAFAFMRKDGNGSEVLRGIAQSDPQRGLELLLQHPDAGEENSWEGIATGLSRSDPQAGIEYALARDYSRFSDIEGVVMDWTHHDPDAAIEFATNLPDLHARRQVLEDVIKKLEHDDPERASEVINDLPPGQMRDHFRRSRITSIARSDLDAALELADDISRPTERTTAIHAIARNLARTAPDSAIELLADSRPPPGSHFDHATLQTLAAQRPAQALAHGIGSTTVADLWVRSDPEAASTWIGGQSDASHYPEMVQGLIWGITRNTPTPDYASAASWALSIEGEAREVQAESLFRAWVRADRAAAIAALRELEDVPDAIHQRYLPPEGFPITRP